MWNSMAVKKYDWLKLKQDFFESEFDDVKWFLREKWVNYTTWWIAKQTKWWTKEKQKIGEKAFDKALEKKIKEEAKKLEVPAELCLRNIKKAIELSWIKLEQMSKTKKISTKDLNNIWCMNRIQNNMPTTYVKSENENMNTERIETIQIIIWANPKN